VSEQKVGLCDRQTDRYRVNTCLLWLNLFDGYSPNVLLHAKFQPHLTIFHRNMEI